MSDEKYKSYVKKDRTTKKKQNKDGIYDPTADLNNQNATSRTPNGTQTQNFMND